MGTLLALACSVTRTEQRVVEIRGGDLDSRTRLAASVIAAVSPSLAAHVSERFPEAEPELLAGLRLELMRISGRQFGEGESKPVDLVGVRCAMTLPEISPKSGAILDYCEELVELALEKQRGSART